MLRTLVCSLALAATAGAQVSHYTASLSGTQEVPPNGSPGSGWAIVRLSEPANTVSVFVRVESLVNPAASAHLHIGPVGVNGPILITLSGGPSNWSGSGTLTFAEVIALKSSGTYVNVHNGPFPAGEVRGQVVTPSTKRFTARLDGAQQVPANGSGALGEAVLFLHEPDNRLVYTVTTSGLTNVTNGHIQQAPVGVNGPIIHQLLGSLGEYCGLTPRLTASQVTALLTNGLYLNVRTAGFLNGEIRGQIRLSSGDDFGGPLSGAQVAPPNASTGVGSVCVQIQPDSTVKYRLEVSGLQGTANGASIRASAPGFNGPLVFNLSGGPTQYSGTSAVLTPTQINDCRTGNWYAVVQSTAFPNGELRAQVLPQQLPTVFGGSCEGTNGVSVRISVDGVACPAGQVRIDGHGSSPLLPGILGFGFSRDLFGGVLPLPFDFVSIGLNAPNCFVLVDPFLTPFVIADALGCFHLALNIPLDLNLVGLVSYAQWYVFDGANPVGIISSNALRLPVQ